MSDRQGAARAENREPVFNERAPCWSDGDAAHEAGPSAPETASVSAVPLAPAELASLSAPANDTQSRRGLPRWFSLVFAAIRRLEVGSLTFVLPDGREFLAEGPQPGPHGRVLVHDPRLFGRMARHGAMGFAEGYLDGWWSTPDLHDVLDVFLDNNARVARAHTRRGLVAMLNRARHWLNRNSRSQAKRNIEAHYDLGNTFYALWLDPSMTYSSAMFTGPESAMAAQSLEEAQREKYRSICDRMELRQGDHVLEIGCGWGGFAEFAARERGVRVTGLTISPAQLEFARERIHKAGLAERVDLRLRDYRDERGQYDGVASIEMFEAVGQKYWPVFFETVRDRLKPGKLASLQVITIADHLFDRYRRSVDFVQKHIFPGGMLPCPAALRKEAGRAGLMWEGSQEFGPSYSETLRRWRRRFETVWRDIEALGGAQPFDERFRRMWTFYLAVTAACFRAGTTDVTQVRLRRG